MTIAVKSSLRNSTVKSLMFQQLTMHDTVSISRTLISLQPKPHLLHFPLAQIDQPPSTYQSLLHSEPIPFISPNSTLPSYVERSIIEITYCIFPSTTFPKHSSPNPNPNPTRTAISAIHYTSHLMRHAMQPSAAQPWVETLARTSQPVLTTAGPSA